jgi:hypothetical protein
MKPLKRFLIKTSESRFKFWVYIYKDLKSMQVEANNFLELRGQAVKSGNLLGICNPFSREVYDEKGKFVRIHEICGIIRLSIEALSTEIVSHEVTHAAFWNYRMEHTNANFGKQCNEKEEDFAYIYGKLFRDITVKLYKHGFWQ